MLGLEKSPCDAINTALKAPELNNLCNLRVYTAIGQIDISVSGWFTASMPRLAANLRYLFSELPYPERFEAAARAGFKAVEYQFPYDHPLDDTRQGLRQCALKMVLINMPPGDWAAGDRGLAACPGHELQFNAALEQAIDYARALECPRINILAGIPKETGQAHEVLRANLSWAARQCGKWHLEILLEAINNIDMPGYFVPNVGMARALITAVAAPNLQLQFDAYHVAMAGDDPVARIIDGQPLPGHVQIADCPGRHEPGTGTLDFASFFTALEQRGYTGWVGCEYQPAVSTTASLDWARQYLSPC